MSEITLGLLESMPSVQINELGLKYNGDLEFIDRLNDSINRLHINGYISESETKKHVIN